MSYQKQQPPIAMATAVPYSPGPASGAYGGNQVSYAPQMQAPVMHTGAPAIASPPKITNKRPVAFAVCVVCCCCVIIIGTVLGVVLQNQCPDGVVLGEEVRNGNNAVGLIFTECPSETSFEAFSNAANRWSNIIAGTQYPTVNLAGATANDACGILENDFDLPDQIDHLIIYAEPVDIDGEGGTLAAAGPCAAFDFNGEVRSMIGIMRFDNADLEALESDGTLEDVILHEMGHVLGLGTLWEALQQGGAGAGANNALLQDPVSAQAVNNVPEFIGSNARDEFQALGGGNGNVPVEDGRLNGQFQIFNVPAGEGLGSINGHWKIEDFDNELMVFAISPDDNAHPLSRMSIASMEDLGYTVNLNLADAYALPNRGRSISPESEKHTHYLRNDVINMPLVGKLKLKVIEGGN